MKSKDDILLEQAYTTILQQRMLKEEEENMHTGHTEAKSHEISKQDIQQLIDYLINSGMDPKDLGQDPTIAGKLKTYGQLYHLNTQKEIEEYLVEYLAGSDLIKKLSPGERLTYKGFDVTDYYNDAYFRYFEDYV
jgi:hypothetical protein